MQQRNARDKTNTDIDKLRAVKYSVMQPAVQDELDGINRSNLDANNYKLDKLDNDKKYVTDVLLSTYLDLSMNRSWRALQDKNQAILDLYNRRVSLAEEETRNRITRRDLMRQLRQQRNHIKSVTYDTDAVIDNLKTQVEDAALNAEIRGRYVDNWQQARSEQHAQKIAYVEMGPSDAIEYYKQTIDREQRVHTEVEMLINININETLQKIESWMNKYDKDIEALEIKIQKKKHEHEKMEERRHELEKRVIIAFTYIMNNSLPQRVMSINKFVDPLEYLSINLSIYKGLILWHG
ncbi:dynein regulatory complex protein 9-like [Manduca sexta]|uniref:dynein regulatory complex protein 9-like n=1 Tax=Manduca sexta TaxID=7130 RepID=UPI00188E985D|nr:dynein regulatory complex protein 9-like [Manduca sexta]